MTTLTDKEAQELARTWLEDAAVQLATHLELNGNPATAEAIREGRKMARYILAQPEPAKLPEDVPLKIANVICECICRERGDAYDPSLSSSAEDFVIADAVLALLTSPTAEPEAK